MAENTDVANLGASFTVMRFFTRVDTFVNSQGRSLDKLLAATPEIADMRSKSCVNALLRTKSAFKL